MGQKHITVGGVVGCWLVGVVASVMAGSPGAARAADGGTPAEITADVGVRARPRNDAPVVQELAAGTSVSVRARAGHWVRIGGAVRGWIPVEVIDLPELTGGARRADPAPGSDAGRDENELMMDAITAERGESPNARRIVRVANDANVQSRRQAVEYADAQRRADAMLAEARLAAAKTAIRRARLRARTASYWKDPFENGPPRLVPSREAATLDLASARREVIRARTEAIAAVVDAEAARAEAAHARADAARARADARGEVLASSEDEADGESPRAGCRDVRSRHRDRLEEASYTPDDTVASHANADEQRERRHTRRRSIKTAMAKQPSPTRQSPPEHPQPSPAAWKSTDSRGIIIEPINKPAGR